SAIGVGIHVPTITPKHETVAPAVTRHVLPPRTIPPPAATHRAPSEPSTFFGWNAARNGSGSPSSPDMFRPQHHTGPPLAASAQVCPPAAARPRNAAAAAGPPSAAASTPMTGVPTSATDVRHAAAPIATNAYDRRIALLWRPAR